MRKDRKSINIMMIIVIFVSIIGIGANIFLIHNDKENIGNTIVQPNEIEDGQYAVGQQKNTIPAMNDVTPEASITEDNTQTKMQDNEEQDTTEQNNEEQNTAGQNNEEQNATGQNSEEQNTTEQHTIDDVSNGTYYIDGASSVNIRSAAYNQAKVVGWLAKGTEVEMIREGKYYSYIKHGNMEGYVYNEYISQK